MARIPSRLPVVLNKFTKINETLIRDVKSDSRDRITVEIGDSKQTDFKPQAKIMRWDNEVNFSLRAEEHPDAVVETEGKLIKYKTPEYEVHQYELDPGEIGEDGGLEFEWVLPSKPSTNVLQATIQTKGLNFYYQPPLTQQEIDEGAERPENVEGSYAVYHATKGGMNRADGMEYKTGKAFHIFRPKVTDANGVETWGELSIDEQNGLLTVTIDQSWLDNAVYPVIVDPTFGYTSIGASNTTTVTPRLNGTLFTSSESGTIQSITAYVNAIATIRRIKGVLVNTSLTIESNGVTDVSPTGSNGLQWLTASYSSEPTISATDYFLTIISDDSSYQQYYDDLGSTGLSDTTNNYTTPTNPTDANTSFTRDYSIYATYTASEVEELSVSVSDSITVTESVQRLLTSFISKSDNITVTESIQRLLTSFVNKSDTVTVTENRNIALASQINKSDTITVTESVNTKGGDGVASVSDTISVSENVKVESTLQVRASDSITVTENTAVDIQTYINVVEAISLSENVKVELNSFINKSDSVTVSENIKVVRESDINVSDTITITENVVVVLPDALQVVTSDSITLSEFVGLNQGYSAPAQDTVQVTENVVVRVSDPQVVVADNVTVTEFFDPEVELNTRVSDRVYVQDERKNYIPNPSFEVNTSGWSTFANGGSAVTTSRDSTHALFGSWALKIVTDGSAVNQQAISPSSMQGLVSQGDTVTGSFYVYSENGGETVRLQINEVNSGGSFLTSGVTSPTVLSSGWNRISLSRRLTNASVNRVQITMTTNAVSPEAVTLWLDGVLLEFGGTLNTYFDGDTSGATWSGTSHNSVSVTSGFNIATQPESFINAYDTIAVQENSQVDLRIEPSVSDTITVTEDVNLAIALNLSVSDSITVTEAVTTDVADPQISVSDTVTVTESVSAITSDPQVVVSDSIIVSESVALYSELNITVSDSITVTESVDPELNSHITVSDSVTITESVVASLTSFVAVSDTITVSESVEHIVTPLFIAVSDTITVTDTPEIFKELDAFLITVSDSITVTEAVSVRPPYFPDPAPKLIYIEGRLAFKIVEANIPHYIYIS